MGILPSMTALALGRSPYEQLQTEETRKVPAKSTQNEILATSSELYEQKYDKEGHPENKVKKKREAQLRTAVNEALASVGVCVDVDGNIEDEKYVQSKELNRLRALEEDKSKIAAVNSENEVGLVIATADMALTAVASTSLLGIRNRFQAFRFYAGVPVLDIIRTDWKHLGPWHFLFGSMPATLISVIIDACAGVLFGRMWYGKQSHQIKLIMNIAGKMLQVASFAIVAQLEIFATLQRLGLLPRWPVIPSAMALIPFTPLSPIHVLPSIFNPGSGEQVFSSLVCSPLPLWWIICYGKTKVERWLYEYVRLALPKPQNPDYYSIKGAMKVSPGELPIPEFERDPDKGFGGKRLVAEVKTDILAFVNKFWKFLRGPTEGGTQEEPEDSSPNDSEQSRLVPSHDPPPIPQSSTGEPPVLATESQTVTTSQQETTGPSVGDIPSHYYSEHLNHDGPSEVSDPPQDSSSQPEPPPSEPVSPSMTPTFFQDPPPLVEDPELPLTAISTPTNTRNMESIAPSQTQNAQKTNTPYHRITILTLHLAEAMGSHVSGHLVEILFFPLETLFVRSVALSFLSSPVRASSPFMASSPRNAAIAASLHSQVFPLWTWFGEGRQGGCFSMADYAAKMAMCAGLEMLAGYGVWQVGAGVVWWIGPTWFNWQSL